MYGTHVSKYIIACLVLIGPVNSSGRTNLVLSLWLHVYMYDVKNIVYEPRHETIFFFHMEEQRGTDSKIPT